MTVYTESKHEHDASAHLDFFIINFYNQVIADINSVAGIADKRHKSIVVLSFEEKWYWIEIADVVVAFLINNMFYEQLNLFVVLTQIF